MIQEVAPGIFRIEVTLPNNPLKWTNSYYIPGPERDLGTYRFHHSHSIAYPVNE